MGLQHNLQTEPVTELALRDPILVKPAITVRDAVLRMREHKLGCVTVVDEDEKPIGEFNEAMLRNLLVEAPEVLDDPVSKHMAARFPWVHSSDPIALVVDAMEAKNTRFVCVLGEDGRVVGLTGQKGLMEYIAEHFPGEVLVHRIGGEPYPQEREGA